MGRGPSYPYVALEDAIGLARKMYDYTKRGAAPVDSVVKDAWTYSPTSSSGQKVLAALKYFGLVEDVQEKGAAGTIKLTQRAIHILLEDQDTPERREEIKKAALSPKWYEFCWKTWGKDMPPAMKSNLLIHHGFIESTVEGFLKDYRKTIAFAGLLDDLIFSEKAEEEEESNTGPKVGDWVQCQMNGELRMPEARKLERIENDPKHGKFGFVEGQKPGIPYKDLIVAEPPAEESKAKFQPPNLFVSPIGNLSSAISPPLRAEIRMQVETFSLPDGVVGQLQWPSQMSAEAYIDFLHQLSGLRMRVRRAVPKESQAEVQSKDEETAKEEAEERIGRPS